MPMLDELFDPATYAPTQELLAQLLAAPRPGGKPPEGWAPPLPPGVNVGPPPGGTSSGAPMSSGDGGALMPVAAMRAPAQDQAALPSMRGSPAGNGQVCFDCWDMNPHFERERTLVRRLNEAVEKMADERSQDRQAIADLRQTVADLAAARVPAVESSEQPNAKAPDKAKKATAA